MEHTQKSLDPQNAATITVMLFAAILANCIFAWVGLGWWIVPILTGLVTLRSLAQPDREFLRYLGLTPGARTLAFTLASVVSFATALAAIDWKQSAADDILALGAGQPERSALLAQADWATLARVRATDPNLARNELARRMNANEDRERADGQEWMSTMWRDLTGASESCEGWVKSLEGHLKSGRPTLKAYQTATNGSRVCFDAWTAISNIKAPEVFPDTDRETLRAGLGKCAEAMLDRKMFLDAASDVLDGKGSFKTLSLAQTTGREAGLATAECYIKIRSVADIYHLEL